MESHLSVLLYSKYSSSSKQILDMIKTSGIDFEQQFKLQYLCIDNKEIRNRIKSNKQMDVTTVPCLLIIYTDGGIEKYDGARIFEWIENIITNLTPKPTQQELQQQQHLAHSFVHNLYYIQLWIIKLITFSLLITCTFLYNGSIRL